MARKENYFQELKQLKEYIKSESNEDAKRPLLYPLFKKVFTDKFKIESDVNNADIYIEGTLLVEAKTSFNDWLSGFYQALHYQKKFGLAYSTIFVIAHKFVGIWKVNKLPEYAVIMAHSSDANLAPNKIGKLNASRTTPQNKKLIQESAVYWLEPRNLDLNFFSEKDKGAKSLEYEIHEILNILKNIHSDRVQINTHNFIQSIEYFKKFFAIPIDAVHCFYAIVAYWDITSTVATNEYMDTFQVVGFKGQRLSEQVKIEPKHFNSLKKYIETHYIFTNEGSGLTADYYFGRFDEVLAVIDPEYVKQHGIFFTDSNLSKFALWFTNKMLPEKINDDYIVFDPAGGSGNLISSWKGKLKHKIISELQPDLLRTIERRMRIDPFHVETGFTIIPKTSTNEGLNFIDIKAEEYIEKLEKELSLKNLTINKPIAFLLNPPYKNTKENEDIRNSVNSNYSINESIVNITGNEAIKERYLAFLGQILNISKIQSDKKLKSLVLIFTPTSWLIPRKAFIDFKKIWDNHFQFISGFLVKSDEFFKVGGKWPLAFTIWKYNDKNEENKINLLDFTHIDKRTLTINWDLNKTELDFIMSDFFEKAIEIKLNSDKKLLRDEFELKLYDFIHTPSKIEIKNYPILGGLPLKDARRTNSKTYGIPNSEFIGFMDDVTPVRIKPRGELNRFTTNNLHSVWFRLDTAIKDFNKSKLFGGAADNRSYCAYDLHSAQGTFSWFAITKSLNGNYPLWANQYDIWQPEITKEHELYYYALCFAYGLSVNSCVVTKFEADNPVAGAPEVFVDNPLCPTNPESFWATTLASEVNKEHGVAYQLVGKITELYRTWNINYCQGQFLYDVGLKEEAYFKYFDYTDFLTPYSGLIQLRKYAEQQNLADLLDLFDEIKSLTKKVKDEIYRLLVVEFEYFL